MSVGTEAAPRAAPGSRARCARARPGGHARERAQRLAGVGRHLACSTDSRTPAVGASAAAARPRPAAANLEALQRARDSVATCGRHRGAAPRAAWRGRGRRARAPLPARAAARGSPPRPAPQALAALVRAAGSSAGRHGICARSRRPPQRCEPGRGARDRPRGAAGSGAAAARLRPRARRRSPIAPRLLQVRVECRGVGESRGDVARRALTRRPRIRPASRAFRHRGDQLLRVGEAAMPAWSSCQRCASKASDSARAARGGGRARAPSSSAALRAAALLGDPAPGAWGRPLHGKALNAAVGVRSRDAAGRA